MTTFPVFFSVLDGGSPTSFVVNDPVLVGGDLGQMLRRMDGVRRYATLVAALPPGVGQWDAKREDYYTRYFLQAGGSADRMIVQVSRDDENGEVELFNLGHGVPDMSVPPAEKVRHGDGWTKVYPEELWGMRDALQIFKHYVMNGQTLPEGLHERLFGYGRFETGRVEDD